MLLVYGSINIDFVFPLRKLPSAGDTLWSETARTEPGGKGANAAVAAAHDGASVNFVGAVGQDVLADAALAGLVKAGVTLSHMARVPDDTGRAAICVDPAGRTTVVAQPGANRAARADQVPDDLLGPRTTVLVQLETEPAETARLIVRAKRLGSRVVLHFSPPRMIDTAALMLVDVLVGNSPELKWAGEHLGTGNNPASLHGALGVPVIRMMGAQGAESMSTAGFRHVPAYPIHMRDTTGAGDCFSGVLAAALSREATLEQAMRRASVAAALSATRIGSQRGMPLQHDIDVAMQSAPQVTDQEAELPD